MNDIVFKISLPHYDVKTTDSKNLVIDSERPNLNIAQIGFIDYTFPDNPSERTLERTHNLGFIPFSWVTYKTTVGWSTAGFLPWKRGVIYQWSQTWDFEVDNQKIYFKYSTEISEGTPTSIQGVNFKFKYYIFIHSVE